MKTPAYKLIRKFAIEQYYRYPNREEQIPSELELCRTFGVSRPTVRKALKDLIDEQFLVIKPGIGTFTNNAQLRNEESDSLSSVNVGVIVQSGRDIFWGSYICRVMAGITNGTAANGGKLRLINLNQERDQAFKEINDYKLDGLIWINPHDFTILSELQSIGLPVVATNVFDHNDSFNVAGYNAETDGFLAGEYFIRQGKTDVVFVSSCPQRLDGFMRAFDQNHCQYNTGLVLKKPVEFKTDLEKMIRFGIHFDGIFVHGYYIHDIAEVLQENGIDIGRKGFILGHDFALAGQRQFDYLDRIHLPLEEIGKSALERIMEMKMKRHCHGDKKVITFDPWIEESPNQRRDHEH